MVLHRLQNWVRTKEETDELFHYPTLNHNIEIPGLEILVNRISLAELCKATDNFSTDNVIGMGKTGTMYKATLQNGLFLAVKRFNNSLQFESRFLSELLALSRLKHDNIVPLLGFCTQYNQMLLVYKHMSNGNLHDLLHGEPKILEWPLRLKIAIGIARALSWLHHGCNFRLVHGAISSKSILLDHHFEPKISNFGKTIISNHGGVMFKYANEDDSDFLVNSGVWESDFVKDDVFKFGIVLLELLTRREAINAGSSTSSSYNNLVEWTNHVSKSPNFVLGDAIDKSLCGQGFDYEIMEVLRVATECVQPFPNQRPTMLQVHERISSLGERYGMITSAYDSGYSINQDTTSTGDEILPVDQNH
ncbi:Probably inactive leucine-rich repeat receptor-like protein kinase [Morus notabilis]|uniref:Probably inactive leucine-rich repeat receptor-like protein kinase n=1 Tax=Morus notabilis TaxID=981085 RepID=W9RF98_9ROSA|nr:probably inactive leucine-rich repeat receptor-like protein kinase At5g48380 [Morus notabilis]EXB88332.1 Probably inactive leucine-rich repeat receptor-like protein kinase [Morus notabilis]